MKGAGSNPWGGLHIIHHLKYHGSSVDGTGGTGTEFTHTVSAEWSHLTLCSVVLCDRRMSVKCEGTFTQL